MAITRDNFLATQQGAAGTSQTVAYTNNGNLLVWYGGVDGTTEVITGVTYNGVSMTQVNKLQEPGARWWYLYILKNPATGTNNLVVSASGSTNFITLAASYAGTDTTTQPDDNASQATAGTQATISQNLTSTIAGDWAFAGVRNDAVVMTGTTNLTGLSASGAIMSFDSNGSLGAAGSKTLVVTANDATGNMYGNFMLIKPGAAGASSAIPRLGLLNVGT